MTTDKQYNWLKFGSQILIPAMGASYFAYDLNWSLPNIEKVLGFLFVIGLSLGILLRLAEAKYNAGVMRGGVLSIIKTDEGETYCLELGDDPEILKTMREVQFDIRKV